MTMKDLKFYKGDIFWNIRRDQHPIIFLEWIDKPLTFKACILSKEPLVGNIKMEDSHFFLRDNSGKDYTIVNKPSYLIKDYSFKKEVDWLKSPIRAGKLTDTGVRYVEENIVPVDLTYSDEHISLISKNLS
ncbi:hypothetical protein [Kaistella faecalis]|uniref:hypothetical protein n=1 Tax=Kaistella faecalis TaxID=2852098 RepID=UPI001C46DAB9|nr:hypothetical protein [Chryseobacterium faecale]UFK97749.1 hypothetical protein LL667_12425 [Chryseobacterium faecale]